MRIGAVSAPATHGYQRQAFIGVRTDQRVRDVADALDGFDEAYYVVVCSGTLDIVVEVMCRDNAHLLDLTCRIRALPGVLGTETYGFLELTEWRYAPGFVDRAPPRR